MKASWVTFPTNFACMGAWAVASIVILTYAFEAAIFFLQVFYTTFLRFFGELWASSEEMLFTLAKCAEFIGLLYSLRPVSGRLVLFLWCCMRGQDLSCLVGSSLFLPRAVDHRIIRQLRLLQDEIRKFFESREYFPFCLEVSASFLPLAQQVYWKLIC